MPERLYLTDSLAVCFEARVTAVRRMAQTPAAGPWQISLDRTAFYPTGGGQPCDLGSLSVSSPGGAGERAQVMAVEEDESGEVWHITDKLLPMGALVQGEVEPSRRRDHMQQHSGQHLLSAVFWRVLGAATVGFHLGAVESTVDLAIESVSREHLDRVEDEANLAIAENLPVTLRTVSREEAEALLASGALRKLPPRQGAIRLVEIRGLDLNACGGTHVRSTGEIGGLAIRRVERVRQHLRVSFACGLRMIRAARTDLETLDRVAAQLSVERDHAPGAVERLLAAQKAASKERQRLREELAEAAASRLLLACNADGGFRLALQKYAGVDGEYLSLVARKVTAADPSVVVLVATASGETGKIVLGAGRDLKLDCGMVLKAVVAARGGRGGGSRSMAQGEVPAARLEEALPEIRDRILASAAG